ncbi:MAG: anti-sigma factor family protein [bacterium]|jgi:hypothetical protein
MKKTPLCMFNLELLVAYSTGNVDSKERSIVEQHLAQCPHCRKEIRLLEESWWALDVWNEEPPSFEPRHGLEDLHRRIAASEAQQPPVARWYDFFHQLKSTVQVLTQSSVLRPALAMGLVVFISISYMADDQEEGNSAPKIAEKQPLMSKAEETPVAIEAGNLSYFMVRESQTEKAFFSALQKSVQQRQEQEASIRQDSDARTVRFIQGGFCPSDNVVPSSQIDASVKPSIIHPIQFTSSYEDR